MIRLGIIRSEDELRQIQSAAGRCKSRNSHEVNLDLGLVKATAQRSQKVDILRYHHAGEAHVRVRRSQRQAEH